MTLEEIKEAVEVIKAYRQMLTDSVSNQIDGDIEAFDIAIEAMERESCGDCVSRQAVDEIKELMTDINGDTVYAVRMSDIRQLPSVNPQPKVGHWIYTGDDLTEGMLKCSECGEEIDVSESYYDFCPVCGAKMEEEE